MSNVIMADEKLTQTGYHCVQYTRRHLMSLISHALLSPFATALAYLID